MELYRIQEGAALYSLTCTNRYGPSAVTQVVVTVVALPTVSLTVNGGSAATVSVNQSFSLAWSSSNAVSCSASGAWSGSKPTSGSQSASHSTPGSYTYTLTCLNAAGATANSSVTVTVVALPGVTLLVNGSSSATATSGSSLLFQWSSTNAVSCTASGQWSGSKATSGSQSLAAPTVLGTYFYILTCYNAAGSSSQSSVTVEVQPCAGCGGDTRRVLPPPTVLAALVDKPGPMLGKAAAAPAQQGGGQVIIQRSSYTIAGQVIATKVTGDPNSSNNGLSYFFNDHLGSNSTLRRPNGTVETTRYLPFGGYRGTAPSQTITDRDFTGQKENMELGLLYYNARFYLPYINRFLSADTIVPDPTNPQSYNRYSYTLNNPLRYTDPSGHCAESGDDTCWSAYDRLLGYVQANRDTLVTTGDSPWFRQDFWDYIGTTYSENEINGLVDMLKQVREPISPVPSKTSNSDFSPDYIKLEVTYEVGAVTFIVDDYSNIYISGGGNLGYDSRIASVRLVGGWIVAGENESGDWAWQRVPPSEEQLKRYLPGIGTGGGMGLIIGWDVAVSDPLNLSEGSGSVAWELGFQSPQMGGGAGYTFGPYDWIKPQN